MSGAEYNGGEAGSVRVKLGLTFFLIGCSIEMFHLCFMGCT